jgi:hypothetical protein
MIQFNGDTCVLKVTDKWGEHRIECGSDRWINNDVRLPGMAPNISRLLWANNVINEPQKASAKYAWIDDNTLTIRLQYLETAHYENITLSFSGRELHVEMLPSYYIAGHPFLSGKRIGYTGRFVWIKDGEG